MVEITLLELEVDDATFTANAPFSGSGTEDADTGTPEEEESSKGAVLGALLGLVFLAVVAAVAKRRLTGGEDEEPIELDEIEA